MNREEEEVKEESADNKGKSVLAEENQQNKTIENAPESYLVDDDDEGDEEFSYQETKSNRMLQDIRAWLYHNKKVLIGIASVIVIFIIVITSVVLLKKKHSTIPSDSSQMEGSSSTENPTIPIVSAAVADINDENDPQQRDDSQLEGNGAVVDADQLKNVHTGDTSNGIDVSKWQGRIDWAKVAASGIDFAIIRVGYRADKTGQITEDPNARYNMQKATKAGIKIGIYFFSTAVNKEEAQEEAAWVADFISKYPITYPVIYNCEGFTESDSRMYGISNAVRTDNAIAFLNYIKNAGYEPMLYASQSEIANAKYWDTSRLEANYRIWIAQYPSVPYPQSAQPSYSGKYSMWQYTNKGKVSGLDGNVDFNVAYFRYDSEAAPKDPSGVDYDADVPLNGVDFKPVNEQVTAKELTNLRSMPSTSSDVVATISSGQFITRVGIGSNGWSKLSYNGKTVYAVTSLLSDKVIPTAEPTTAGVEDGISFSSVNEQVTPKDEVNLRIAPKTSGGVAATIQNGTVCVRTGVGDNGWSRLSYNGQTVYAVSSYLTTDLSPKSTAAVQPPATKQDSASKPDSGIEFTTVNDSVTSKDETNLRDKPSTDGSTVVATLKKGDFVTRTGTSSSGWSRLTYNGQTVYAITSYLTN